MAKKMDVVTAMEKLNKESLNLKQEYLTMFKTYKNQLKNIDIEDFATDIISGEFNKNLALALLGTISEDDVYEYVIPKISEKKLSEVLTANRKRNKDYVEFANKTVDANFEPALDVVSAMAKMNLKTVALENKYLRFVEAYKTEVVALDKNLFKNPDFARELIRDEFVANIVAILVAKPLKEKEYKKDIRLYSYVFKNVKENKQTGENKFVIDLAGLTLEAIDKILLRAKELFENLKYNRYGKLTKRMLNELAALEDLYPFVKNRKYSERLSAEKISDNNEEQTM